MSWRIILPPDVHQDIREASAWYERQETDLGQQFIREVLRVLDSVEKNPLLVSRRHGSKDIRWRSTRRFPYRVIYRVDQREGLVMIAAVLHAARHDRAWRHRV